MSFLTKHKFSKQKYGKFCMVKNVAGFEALFPEKPAAKGA